MSVLTAGKCEVRRSKLEVSEEVLCDLLRTSNFDLRSSPPSEHVSDSNIQSVGPIFVARQNPRETVGLIVLQQDDLIARGRRQAARVGQVHAVRDALADGQTRGRIETR